MRNMKRTFGLVLIIVLVLSIISTVSAAGAGEKKYSIGAIVPTLGAQFWNRYVDFMKQGAEELGCELVVLNADNKADNMVRYIEDLSI